MVEVDGQEVEKSLAPRCHHGVASVVHVRPGIGALCQATVGQEVQHTLEGGEDLTFMDHHGTGLTLYGYCSLPMKIRCSRV